MADRVSGAGNRAPPARCLAQVHALLVAMLRGGPNSDPGRMLGFTPMLVRESKITHGKEVTNDAET